MAINRIDGMMLKEMLSSGAALLVNNREQVDALNVFPVPDGDTGTNMSQTITSAIKEINAKPYTSVADVSNAAAKGALRGARGNSGVILSQILRGFAKALAGHEELDAPLLCDMLRSGANTAYKAVMKPKEGTILTVIRVIAEETEAVRDRYTDLGELFKYVLTVGDAILKRTPEMLPVLKQAGVVDSGGMGLMVVFRGMYAAMTGEPVDAIVTEPAPGAPGMPGEFVDDHEALEEIKFGYCTEFIVSHPREGLKDDEVVRLRRRLERIGDCVLVIADMNVVKVHVHTNEPGKALQYALELGELDSIKIDNMFEERREREAKLAEEAAAKAAEQKDYGIVAVALGDGLVELFKDLNVDQVVDGGQTMNPSIQDLAQACDATNARNVIILPNNTNIILAAQQAVELTERNVIVLPTKSVPMGISAALAFDPALSPEENEAAMKEAAEAVHTASITYAVRDTNYDGQEIHEHDIMGMLDNKLTVLGHDIAQVARDITEKMVSEDSSLVTIYYGQDVQEADARALCDSLAEIYPDCDVELQRGGQPLYYYLIAVE
ncbi:MAG: DAK2 domain-containing protein [Clostridia bacterium]|nr:DAK2 domain-containing protein [Clostridia bacterium]